MYNRWPMVSKRQKKRLTIIAISLRFANAIKSDAWIPIWIRICEVAVEPSVDSSEGGPPQTPRA